MDIWEPDCVVVRPLWMFAGYVQPMISTLAYLAMLAPPEKDKPAPAVDRSAEPILRRLMDECARIKDLEVDLLIEGKDDQGQMVWSMPIEASLKSAKVFRLSFADTWGSQTVFTSDGTSVMHDSFDDSVPIEIKSAGKPIYSLDESLSARGSNASPFWYFLGGSDAMAALVDKTSSIVEVPVTAPFKAVEFKSAGFGTVVAFYLPGRTLELEGFQYDNLPFLQEMHRVDPEDFPEPVDPLGRQMLRVSKLRAPKGLFEIAPPVGHPLVDSRKKHD